MPYRAFDAEAALVAGADPSKVGALASAEVAAPYRRALIAELVRRAVA